MNRRRLGLVVGTLAFTLLFASCEKDISENIGKGEKAEIFFSLNTTNYNTAADVVRSAGARETESTTMYINDSLYLQTTLIPDLEGDLRAIEPFINGQRICFEAFDISDPVNPVDSKIYTYSESTGKFTPLTTPLGVDPDGSTIYRFVAYSYFGEANTTPSATIDLSKDLVWGKSATDRTVVDTETSRTVDINMNHLFAQVKVKVQSGISGATITVLEDVEIEGGTQATLVPFDGSFSLGNALTQGIDFDTSTLPDAEIESGQRLVFPVAAARVKFGTVGISATNTTFYDQTVAFNSGLDAGTSYALVVDVKKCIWSRSNIYWQAVADDEDPKYPGYLTFVPAGTDLTKQGYQGVFFKWGSLVGISPVLMPDADMSTYAFSASTPVYKPDGFGGWVRSTGSVWGDIPYFDSSYDTPGDVAFGRNNRYAIEDEQNTSSMYQGLRGDICQYLSTKTGTVSGNYRLPTANELVPASGWTMGGSFSYAYELSNAEGTLDLLDATIGRGWAKNSVMGDVVFPVSGSRYYTDGRLGGVGTEASYLSGSAPNTTHDYVLSFRSSFSPSAQGFTRGIASPVRCVQKLD